MTDSNKPFSVDDFTPAERDRLEQELLELHFGCHEDPAALQARLANEPALQALQQQVLQQAEVLAAAAQPEQPQLDLPHAAPDAAPSRRPFRLLRSAGGRLLLAGVIAATVVLGFFVAGEMSRSQWLSFQHEHLHVTVSAPRAVPDGAPWSFTVESNDLRGMATECRVRWQAFDADGNKIAADEAATIGGTATIAMPANLRRTNRLEVHAVTATDEVQHVLQLSAANAGPLVHVSTDRPVYRPGEPIMARAIVLDRVTRLPLPADKLRNLQARLLDAKGSPVAQEWQTARAGTAAFVLTVPANSPGGTHQVEVRHQRGAFPPETAEVIVRSFQQPRLKKTIVLDRVTYAPGARGSALVVAERMGGGVAAGAAAVGRLVIDGDEVWSDRIILDRAGEGRFRFAVPDEVEKGAARFVAIITDGGIVETELKPFVVPTGEVLVRGFPEGGELIAGVENGLYLECTDPLGRAVDTIGEILDDRGDRIERFRTTHQGRTRLSFVPVSGRSYSVRLAGDNEPHALPAVQDLGIALLHTGDQIAVDAPLRLQVAGRGDGPWVLGVFCRGVMVGQTTLRPGEHGELRAQAEVELPPHAVGVLRATVFDRQLQPIAERLVRRASGRRIDIALSAEHLTLNPGEQQTITVRTADETGEPMPAMVGVTVADLGALSLGSEPRVGLLDHASLWTDVEKVENLGDFFLGNADGARNADLLLGTRGWRRFVWRNDDAAKDAIEARGDWAAGLLAREGFSQAPQVASNLGAAKAAGDALSRDAWRSERRVGTVVVTTIWLLVLALIGEGLAVLLRSARAPQLLKLTGSVAAFMWLLLPFLPSALGASDMAPAAGNLDFTRDELADSSSPATVTLSRPAWGDARSDAEMAESAFDSGAWNSAVGLGSGAGGGETRPSGTGVTSLAPAGFDVFAIGGEAQIRLPRVGATTYRTAMRDYAHTNEASAERTDFTPTIAWSPLLMTNDRGEASLQFDTSDAVTTWLVSADAHATTRTGRVGQGTSTFTTRLPFAFDVKLPDEISAGDELLLPIAAIAEGLQTDAATLTVQVSGDLQITGTPPTTIALQNGRGRALVRVTTTATAGFSSGTLTIEGGADRFTDRLTHTIRIAPRGFPHRRSFGGSLSAGSPATFALAIPADAVPGSGKVTLKVFPSPLSGLMEGMQGLLQEPHGCFEQASSTNYPNTMVLALLEATGDNVPEIAARARQLLPRGYAKITSYECKQRGYEWFGGDPGHDALTAYGLLQFHDMQRVYDVDAAMVERTRQWLLGRRNGDGGYQGYQGGFGGYGRAPQPTTDAYVTYALLQSGVEASELQTEIEALVARTTTDDAYELALISCALHLADRPEAQLCRQRLAAAQQADGSLQGTTTITRSGGNDLAVETTGFAVLAWLTDPAFAGNVRKATDFLNGSRGASGRFGTTQATIVALRALTAYATEHRGMREDGTLRVFYGNDLLVEREFTAGDNRAIELELWDKLHPGEHELRLEVEGGGTTLPWACDLTYHGELPADDADGVVAVATRLRQARVREGETTALDVTVQNMTDEGQPMALAVIGLPAGCELSTKVLEDLQRDGAFAFWELRGRELALYWRDLAPQAKHELTLDLIARVPGSSRGPASRAGLYYTPDSVRWAAPVSIDIVAQ